MWIDFKRRLNQNKIIEKNYYVNTLTYKFEKYTHVSEALSQFNEIKLMEGLIQSRARSRNLLGTLKSSCFHTFGRPKYYKYFFEQKRPSWVFYIAFI